MAFYEFIDKDGKKRVVQCGMSKLPALVERMKREGWRRLYSVPQVVVTPGYYEAVEESHQVMADEEKKMARDRAEAGRDVAEAVREELR
jgi:predicted membrane GTPase involved in stress response